MFTQDATHPIPFHPHIYSNGIICLDLLGPQGWSPVQNVESICMSIQSMLTGNTKKERPPGDEELVRRVGQRPRDMAFIYDDDKV
jgi:ubiquitin-conjugating enzyme E2 W